MRTPTARTLSAAAAAVLAAALGLAAVGTTTASASSVTRPVGQQWRLDPTFGTGGMVLTGFPFGAGGLSEALSGVIQADGEIVVGGFTSNLQPRGEMAAIARYLPNGDLDDSFGDGGRVVIGPHTGYGVTQVALQTVGDQTKIVLAVDTTFFNPLRDRCSVIRLNSDGSLDNDQDADPAVVFGDEGIKVIRFADNSGGCWGMTVTPSGDIVGTVVAKSHQGDVGVFRLHADDGSLDPTFGGDGKMTVVARGYQVPSALALQPMPGQPDSIVVGGLAAGADGYNWAMWRITSDGRLDRTFGKQGRVVTTMRDPRVERSYDSVQGLAVTPDGHILASGDYRSWPEGAQLPEDTAAVAEYLPDGALDRSFGDRGRAHLPYDSHGATSAADVTFDAAGRVLFAGSSYGAFLVGGFEADGSPDARFGAGGFERMLVGKGGVSDAAQLRLDAAGRMVVAGLGYDPSGDANGVFGVIRLDVSKQP